MSEISSHPFVPAGEHDSRSPCPALNALANHSYLHHDGRKLTVPDLIRTMREVYHISLPLASILSVLGALICGNGWSFDLEDLAKHNKIEHDGSLAHADAAPGYLYAPSVPDKELLDKLLSLSSDGRYITFEDFVRERADRDEGLSKPLSGAHNIIARGEIALTCQVFGDEEGRVPKEFVQEWYGQERLPEGWSRPARSVGVVETSKLNNKVATMSAQMESKDDF
ncbi:heme-thiolate peroxidase [Bondarzewia mesenterica]|uniref:Heme-thiolate peroxidase n=1 Tax=Bondarzewia mesenterica TaxID=1095465 RepID=A0A4S4MA07_9AGAM|nr:heme-thiolate peroxidase [Bondarzewia mesenterica]